MAILDHTRMRCSAHPSVLAGGSQKLDDCLSGGNAPHGRPDDNIKLPIGAFEAEAMIRGLSDSSRERSEPRVSNTPPTRDAPDSYSKTMLTTVC